MGLGMNYYIQIRVVLFSQSNELMKNCVASSLDTHIHQHVIAEFQSFQEFQHLASVKDHLPRIFQVECK